MIGLRPWADICLGIGFLVFFFYFLIMMWRRSRRNKSSPNANDLMQKALVETGLSCSQSAYIQQSGNKYSFFVDGALHEKNIHQNNASDTPTRAFNLDKADKEYKGRHYIKAKQAALGEEVRRKIAGLEHKDIHILVEEDQRQKHALKEGREHNDANKELNGSRSYTSGDSSLSASSVKTGVFVPGSSEMNWGRCYTQKELEMATNSFSDSNVLGYGSDGIVYHGTLPDGTPIVLKNLSNNRGQADKDFKLEVEAVGRVRHKNLVRLSGYCMEGSQRFLVYEYIENGNLEQWLHGTLGKSAPLPWDVRMKIIIGTARGLAYLHEGLEPKVVHRDVKPSNILLDSLWNPKVSDFGFAKLLGADKRHVTTRVMGTFGYVAPEYVSTGMLTEKSDVYSYGVLVMELITGRVPVDHNRPIGEIHLIEWLKSMVGSRRSEEVADPSMTDRPPPRSLKRALLVALRCVDPDDTKRPTMSHVVHMLESMDDSPSCQVHPVIEVS
ncbi:hypothetical protein KP509_32G029400 [Ceratopteris richardii]|uniref:non-specific serine/threonine protein kinase n=1 Tax=Ceratopteris richardii TaxID=49495 RepID=A0A8T2QU11_CERRI|nr:hypothetical protein KP509_32G029400 [Ceratopteris richardii]KAH7286955.1 hypothetical protein KP509_32G029400 [Ceratopteris richardii]